MASKTLARGMGTFRKTCPCPKPTRCPHPYVIRYRDAQGKQREEGGYSTQDEAKDRLIKLHGEKRTTPADVAEQRRELGDMRFEEFATEWLQQQRHLADGSHRVVKPSLNNWLIPRLGSRRMNTFTPRVTEKFLLDLEREKTSDSVQHRSFQTLRSVLKAAERQGATVCNAMEGVVPPKYIPDRVVVPSLEEIRLARGSDDEIRLLVDIMSGCGLRTAEACAVNINNIVADDVYRITEQIHNKSGDPAPLKHRAKGDFREVPLPAKTRLAILGYAEKHGMDEHGFLLRTSNNNYWTNGITSYRWNKARKNTGISANLRLYSMRHYFASNCLSNNIPITDVAEWMGHSSIEITFKTYRFLMPGSISKAAKILDSGLAA
ncbi:tyrosine-type recombinase/integrase [Streptomyces hebeiensis]|uniref:tyrosine-type recombinase/integrase n=1 Tax=Streptomyces hebeiensis TaxID=229486 RepID=UPI0031D03043